MTYYFPVVIKYTGEHVREPSAETGRDYKVYELIRSPEDLPKGTPFKIIATNVHIG